MWCVDNSSALRDIVFSHTTSCAMVNAYQQALIIDMTYNTNEYGMTLLEAVGATSTDRTFTFTYTFTAHERQDNFKCVLQFIQGLCETRVASNVVVIDKAYALMNAVDMLFPESQK